MQIKFYLNRLETILKKEFQEIDVDRYYSRRTKLVTLLLINLFMSICVMRISLKKSKNYTKDILEKVLN